MGTSALATTAGSPSVESATWRFEFDNDVFFAGLSFDTAIDGNVGLGNLFTQVSAALEMRFGHNMPSGLVIVGLHYERKNWGIHFSVMESSDNVDTNQAPAAENRERLGAIDIEWRF